MEPKIRSPPCGLAPEIPAAVAKLENAPALEAGGPGDLAGSSPASGTNPANKSVDRVSTGLIW